MGKHDICNNLRIRHSETYFSNFFLVENNFSRKIWIEFFPLHLVQRCFPISLVHYLGKDKYLFFDSSFQINSLNTYSQRSSQIQIFKLQSQPYDSYQKPQSFQPHYTIIYHLSLLSLNFFTHLSPTVSHREQRKHM